MPTIEPVAVVGNDEEQCLAIFMTTYTSRQHRGRPRRLPSEGQGGARTRASTCTAWKGASCFESAILTERLGERMMKPLEVSKRVLRRGWRGSQRRRRSFGEWNIELFARRLDLWMAREVVGRAVKGGKMAESGVYLTLGPVWYHRHGHFNLCFSLWLSRQLSLKSLALSTYLKETCAALTIWLFHHPWFIAVKILHLAHIEDHRRVSQATQTRVW